jgi:hypothetical protein
MAIFTECPKQWVDALMSIHPSVILGDEMVVLWQEHASRRLRMGL